MQLHNDIARLALEHFKNIPKTGKPTFDEWTVISAIIKENCEAFEVVSLGSGSKCLGKSSLSKRGDVLNDSHAEIVTRRGFLRYLYGEIERDVDSEIFERENKVFVLKKGVKFHFFTTHVPCGDAAIFPKMNEEDCGKCLESIGKRSNESDGNVSNKKLKNQSGDIYRTGGKCLWSDAEQDPRLEGASYHLLGKVRTKPGRGDPTLSVSCCDKLTKWHQIGLQGALLSLFIPQPLHFTSFTIVANTPFCEKALYRSFFDRLNNCYKNTRLLIGQANVAFDYCKDDGKRPSANSIIWYKNRNASWHEVAVNGRKLGVTKKRKDDPKSRLSISKIEMFRCFVRNVKRFGLIDGVDEVSYREAKLLAGDYQRAWNELKSGGFKIWTTKDPRLLEFYVD